MAEFKNLMNGFGVVTVMNVRLFNCSKGYTSLDKPLVAKDFVDSGLYIDTLKIANLTQEGPTKTITGGQYANPLIKYGKTMTCEMQDALGRGEVLVKFFGCETDTTDDSVTDKTVYTVTDATTRISVGDKFPGAFALEGETFFIDQETGEKVNVYIFIPQFTPDAILSLTQDAEGDATVFDLNGSVSVTKIADSDTDKGRDVFYEIRKERFCTVTPKAE